MEFEFAVTPGYENVCRTIIRNGREHRANVTGNAKHDVADALVKHIAHEAAAVALPLVNQSCAQIARHYFSDAVVVSLLARIGGGHCRRVGTDAQFGGARESCEKQARCRRPAKEARTHRACLLWL